MKESIVQALSLEQYRAIAIIGGGGKTTLMGVLANEFDGERVAMCTTTKIYKPKEYTTNCRREHMQGVFANSGCMTFGSDFLHKLANPPDDFFTYALEYCDRLLIEADGSARLPLKAPNDTEPVYVPNVDCVIAVLGLGGIGKTIGECCHRPELVCGVLQKSVDDLVTVEDILLLLTHKDGVFKNAPNVCKKVVLNQMDTVKDPKDIEMLEGFSIPNITIRLMSLQNERGTRV